MPDFLDRSNRRGRRRAGQPRVPWARALSGGVVATTLVPFDADCSLGQAQLQVTGSIGVVRHPVAVRDARYPIDPPAAIAGDLVLVPADGTLYACGRRLWRSPAIARPSVPPPTATIRPARPPARSGSKGTPPSSGWTEGLAPPPWISCSPGAPWVRGRRPQGLRHLGAGGRPGGGRGVRRGLLRFVVHTRVAVDGDRHGHRPADRRRRGRVRHGHRRRPGPPAGVFPPRMRGRGMRPDRQGADPERWLAIAGRRPALRHRRRRRHRLGAGN